MLNLSNNSIENLEINHPMAALTELNLRKNSIKEVCDLKSLTRLQKLYLSNNQISTINAISSLPMLQDLTMENNPVDKSAGFVKFLRERFPSLNFYNLQKVTALFDIKA